MSELGVRVAEIAKQEWWYFGSQYVEGENSKLPISMDETGHGVAGAGELPGFRQRVLSYFRDGVFPDDGETWRDYQSWAWSGAFISYCFRKAGARDGFPYSPAHHKYVLAGMDRSYSLVTCAIEAEPPGVGDLLWKGRLETQGWTYDDLVAHTRGQAGAFRSHCDIVTDVDYDNGEVTLIGGNVRDRVLALTVPLDANGMIVSKVYTVMVQLAANAG